MATKSMSKKIPHDLLKFVPEVPPEPDEIEAIAEGRKDRGTNGTIPHDAINWD